MHDGMQYDLIQCQGQGHEPFKFGNTSIFKSCLRYLQWEMATDHGFLNLDTISKFDGTECFISGLVFVSRDFEVGRNVSSEDSTVSPIQG